VLAVKDFDSGHYVNGVHIAGAGVCKYRYQNMLLHVERPWVQAELPPRPSQEHAFRHRCRHQLPQRHHRDLRRDGGDGQWLPAVPEELV